MGAIRQSSKNHGFCWQGGKLFLSLEVFQGGAGFVRRRRCRMAAIVKRLRAFWRDDEGATATEYAVMIALVIIVCIGAVSALGDKVSQVFADASVGW